MANLFETKLGKLFPALGQLRRAGVTDEMWEKIGNNDGEYARVVYEALLARMSNTITIPADATAEGLIAEAKAEFEKAGIPLTESECVGLDENWLQLVRQDLELVRGKTLKFLVHDFGRDWEPSEGRGFQKERGFDGNAAAFIAWMTKTKLRGWYVSIPNDDARLYCDPDDGGLFAASFFSDEDIRDLDMEYMGCGWDYEAVLVAFSEI